MKRATIYSFLLFATTLCGCDKKVVVEEPTQKISFGVDVQTRAAATTATSIQQFGVFCFDTGGAFWTAVGSTAIPNKLFNRLVERIDDNWIYSPAIEWGGGGASRFTFFGYSPYATGIVAEGNLTGNNISLSTTANSAGVPSLNFETISEVVNQQDLLVSAPHYDLRPSPKPVQMIFDHALTKVGFKAYSAAAGTFIESIEIIGVQYKGSLTLAKPQRWSVNSATTNFLIDFWGGVPVRGSEDNPVDVSAPGNYLMVVPQDFSSNTTAKFIFRYRQGVATGLIKEYTLKENWKAANGTIYVLDLGGNPNSDVVVDRIEMEDWKVEQGGNFEI